MICIHSEGVKRCLFCHRKLKDAISISIGIGSDCWEMFLSGVPVEYLLKPWHGRDIRYQELVGSEDITLKPSVRFNYYEIKERVFDKDKVARKSTVIICLRCGNVRPWHECIEDIYTPFAMRGGQWTFLDSVGFGVFRCRHPDCDLLSRYKRKEKTIDSNLIFNGLQGLINKSDGLKTEVSE